MNTKNSPISVVIPSYNEELGIQDVIHGVHSVLQNSQLQKDTSYEIIVVDDGSTDQTASIAQNAGARVIRHPLNMGYGKSLLTGFGHARFDWILTIDGDGSYPTEEIGRLLPYLRDFDMVIGARRGIHFWGNPLQAVLRWIYLKMAKFVAGENVPDANSGLRAIRREALRGALPIQCLGYSFSTTMTLSFLKQGRFVRFVPIAYQARRGQSKVRRLRDIPRTLQLMTQVIVYFNPLKLAVALASVPMAISLGFGFCHWIYGGYLLLCLSSFYFSLLIFWLGCLLESIRSNKE